MMKCLAALLPLALLTTLPVSATVSITVDAGLLTDHTGADLANGNLILVLGSSSGVFTPTIGSEFVSGDNLILGSSTTGVSGALAMDDVASGIAGETFNNLTFNYGLGSTGNSTPTASNFAVGDKIAIRWYDDFTLAQFEAGATPTAGYYGTYTTLLTAAPDGGVGWVGPADGFPYNSANGLNFFTLSDAGTQANIEGQALTPVVSDSIAVPEPSTYALLAAGLLIVVGMARRKRLAVVAK